MIFGRKVMFTGKIRHIVLLTLIGVVLVGCVGGTIAWLSAKTKPVVNTFTPSNVKVSVDDRVSGNVKHDVVISNTGNTDAYIRAAITANWYIDDDIVAPWDESKGTFTDKPGNGWEKVGSYYYYTLPVAPGDATGTALFKNYTAPEAPVEGAHLEMTIIAQAIQSMPKKAIQEAGWDWQPN